MPILFENSLWAAWLKAAWLKAALARGSMAQAERYGSRQAQAIAQGMAKQEKTMPIFF